MPATRTVNGGSGHTSVQLDALPPIGDRLVYRVTSNGSQPDFEIVEQGTKKVLLRPGPTPVQTQTRRWPTEDEAQPLQPEQRVRHILAMKFLGVASYRFVVERRDASDNLVDVLLDVTWSSDSPDTTRFEPFTVSIAPN